MYFVQRLGFHALYLHYVSYLTMGSIKLCSMNCSMLLAHGISVSMRPFIGEIYFTGNVLFQSV